jgi:hypothetical protein
METVIARLYPDSDPQVCGIQGCSKPAEFQSLKLNDDDSEKEEFFCERHGQEYALRGHLVISEDA